eukprot:IDg10334t1
MTPAEALNVTYPATRRSDVTETLHGREIADPYRWLEDPDSAETSSWIDEQNKVTRNVLDTRADLTPRFRSTIEQLMDYDRYSAPFRKGDYIYFSLRRGLSNQPVLMRGDTLDVNDDDAVPFIDPNAFASDGTAALAGATFSPRGTYCAYALSMSGSDWTEIRVRRADTRKDLSECLEWAKFSSVAWSADESGFYYTRYPVPLSLGDDESKDKRGAETDEARDQAVYYHALNTAQSEDRLVYSDTTRPKRMYYLTATLDGAYLVLTVSEDCAPKNQVWVVNVGKHFGKEGENMFKLVDETPDSEFVYIANDDNIFYLRTNWNAPNNRVIAADLSKPREQWAEIVAEHPHHVLSCAQAAHTSRLVLVYMQDAKNLLSIHALRTGELLHDVVLPDLGSVSGVCASREHAFLTYVFSGYLYAGTVFYVDLNMPYGDGTRTFRTMTPPGFQPELFETRQVFIASKDGTRVPMFIVAPRERAATRPPTLLYGYGGFSISLTPSFSARWASWLQCMGGVVVVANLRGGSEYGSEWHRGGILGRKQNVFDDFQAAARALAGELRVTSADRIAIMGGSNGGLLVGACANQTPELYGAAIAQVGVMDMLRFHRFTIGSAWVSDYGNPDEEGDFQHIEKYSPLHNVFNPDARGVPYPATLLLTGDHDDRVVPLHTLKLAATLQHRAGSAAAQRGRPLLLRVDVKAGHGAGKPTTKIIDEMCDTLIFCAIALNADI